MLLCQLAANAMGLMPPYSVDFSRKSCATNERPLWLDDAAAMVCCHPSGSRPEQPS